MKHKRLIICLLAFLVLLEPLARVGEALAGAPDYQHSYQVHFTNGHWEPDDYISPPLNIHGGERRTVGQPTHYQHTIWLYGNSVLFGFKVADDDTIASRLQALLPTYRVVNHSAIGQSYRGQLAWLKADKVAPGDVVVFGSSAKDVEFAERKSKPVAQWLWNECDLPPLKRSVITLYAVACDAAPLLPSDPAVYAYYMDDLRQTIRDARGYLQQEHVAFIEWSSLPLNVPVSGYVDNAGHYNRQGAELVGRAIFNWITVL